MSHTEFERLIRDHLTTNLLYVEDEYEYDDNSSFIGSGLIDSMGVMELVTYVQSSFGITVKQKDIVPDNFDSINKLAAFIRREQALNQVDRSGVDRDGTRAISAKQFVPSK